MRPRNVSTRPRLSARPRPSSLSVRPSGVGVIAVTPRLLVIDDDDMVRRSLVRLLRRKYTVTEQRDAEGALALIKMGVTFDAILCDLNLTGMSGRDFLLQLIEHDADQASRVVILSGNPRSGLDEAFLEAIASRFLEKPATLAEIDTMLDQVTSTGRAHAA
jgi:two-component system NtrC family sensor kinase